MYYVYILQSEKDSSFYTGFTANLRQQIRKHNEGAQRFTSTKKPYELEWYCSFKNKSKALKFEKYLKSGSGFAFAKKHLIQKIK